MKNLELCQPRQETDPRKPVANLFFFGLPFLFFVLFFLIIQKNPLNFHLVFSDELDYWAEAATLSERGLFSPNAGYFGYSFGNHAPLLYFGAHGFFSLIPHALFGVIAPRTHAMVLLLNGLFMGISLVSAYFLLGSFRKTLAIALALFAFYPFFLYYQTGMIETLFYAGSIVLAILSVKCFTPGPRQGIYLQIYFWLVILFSLFRLSNFVLIIPVFLIDLDLKKQNVLFTCIKYGVIGAAVALLSVIFAATYPWGFLGELSNSNNVLSLVLENTLSNLRLFFDLKAGYSLEILPRFLFFAWLIFVCIFAFATRKRNTRTIHRFLLSQILVMLGLVILNITLYDIGSFRDLRVFSPLLVFSMISFYLSMQDQVSRKFSITIALLLLVVSFYPIIKEHNLVQELFITNRYKSFDSPQILAEIRYNPTAKTRWENTVYVDLEAYGQLDWTNYDPGVGLMVLGASDIENLILDPSGSNLKAKYIFSTVALQQKDYNLIDTKHKIFVYSKDKME